MAPKRKPNKVVAVAKGPASPSGFSRTAPDPAHDVHKNDKPNIGDSVDGDNSGDQPADDAHDEQDENNTDDDDDRTSSTPPVPSNLHRDMSHIAKHLQDQSSSLFSAINFMHYIKSSIGNTIQSAISRLTGITDIARNATDYLCNLIGERAAEVVVKSMDEAGKWIVENPGRTGILIFSGTALVAPGLVVGPALGLLGFGAGGVGSGTLAAGLHAVLGDVATGSVFASAGAGGAGLAVVNGVVQAVAVGTGVWTAWRKRVGGMGRGDGSVDTEEIPMESTVALLPDADTSRKAKNRTAKAAGGFNASGIENETRTVKEELTATEKKTIKNRKRKAAKKKAKANKEMGV